MALHTMLTTEATSRRSSTYSADSGREDGRTREPKSDSAPTRAPRKSARAAAAKDEEGDDDDMDVLRSEEGDKVDLDALLSNTQDVQQLRKSLMSAMAAQAQQEEGDGSAGGSERAPAAVRERRSAPRSGADADDSRPARRGGARHNEDDRADEYDSDEAPPRRNVSRQPDEGRGEPRGGRGPERMRGERERSSYRERDDRGARDSGRERGREERGDRGGRERGGDRYRERGGAERERGDRPREREGGYRAESARSGGPRDDSVPPGASVAVLKPDKARLFANGNPMVYGGAVDFVTGRPPPDTGDAVMVTDASREALGWGVFNPSSMFRVRLMQMRSEYEADPACLMDMPALIQLRVRQAAALRRSLGLPSKQTDAYRLLNSEGDGLSGVIADVLGSTVVVQSVAAWAQKHRADVEAAVKEVVAAGQTRPGTPVQVVWRPNWGILKEEGIEPPPGALVSGSAAEGVQGGREEVDDTVEGGPDAEGGADSASAVAVDPLAGSVEVREGRLRFLASPMGQKTGFYADQRDSRAFLAGLVRAAVQSGAGSSDGYSLADLCCYSGGFAIAAAAAGAMRVVGVDSSAPAIALARANAGLNGLAEQAVSFERADVSDWMKDQARRGVSFDAVVLDPPKLAPSRASLERARMKYLRLNALALKLVRPGGLLMTCSCSGAMTQSGKFVEVVMEAARQAGRHVTLLRSAGAAPDHPLNPAYPESTYLTNVTFRVL